MTSGSGSAVVVDSPVVGVVGSSVVGSSVVGSVTEGSGLVGSVTGGSGSEPVGSGLAGIWTTIGDVSAELIGDPDTGPSARTW